MHPRTTVIAAVTTLLIPQGVLMAQSASSTRQNTSANSSRRVNTRSDFSREVEFRNAIATGNAPGGLSFRGDLGYTAPSAFRGELGSDALFAYRRDSIYSGLAGMGIRGTEALQYQFSLTTGSSPTRDLIGSPTVTRLGGGGTTDASSPVRIDTSFDNSTRISTRAGSSTPRSTRAQTGLVDPSVTGTLRSTSSHRSSSSLSPEIVSVFTRGIEQDRYGVVASPLLGLVSTPMNTARSTRSESTGARSATQVSTTYSDTVARVKQRAEELFERQKMLAEGKNPDAPQRPERPEAPVPDTGIARAQQPENADQWVQSKFVELYQQIQGRSEIEPLGTQFGEEEPEIPVPNQDNSGLTMADPDLATSTEPLGDRRITVDPVTLELIRANKKTVSYLIDPDAENRDVFTEHIRAGERLMRRQRYFDAEERFTRALALKRGDVSAQIGRLHAQIGAGLVISASVNLQTLLIEHPELIAQKYDGSIIPSGDRAEQIMLTLSERAGVNVDDPSMVPEPTPVRIASSFLLAYMGFQTEREDIIDQALRVVEQIGGPADARLASMYRQFWLPDPTQGDGTEP